LSILSPCGWRNRNHLLTTQALGIVHNVRRFF
jgi:hypothetical protein